MFRQILFITTLTLSFLLTSCKNGSQKESAATVPQKETKLEIPEVPVTVTDPQMKVELLLKSFWNNYDFTDTTKLEIESYTAGPLYAYLSIVKKTATPEVLKIYDTFLNTIMNAAPKVREKFLTLIEYNYYHPNSQIRDEALYTMAIDKALLISSFPKSEAERYLFQKRVIAKNNPGSKAQNFPLMTKDGRQLTLYGIKSKFTVMILFDPECEHCIATIEQMKSSPVFLSEKVKVMAVMPENNKTKFMAGAGKLPADWISGYDYKEEIMNNLLYDLRPSPSLYLLNDKKEVIIKDGFLPQIENYLAGVI